MQRSKKISKEGGAVAPKKPIDVSGEWKVLS